MSQIKDEQNQPLVTVITVVYNNRDFIENTIKSVLGQTYKNIEYIVIDGQSTDGTVEIIEKYRDKISVVLSEPDKGVYDAMNKGIDLVSGEWVNFLNAGDQFCSKGVIETIFTENPKADLVYGDAKQVLSNNKSKEIKASKNLEKLWQGAKFGHESLFVRSEIIKKHKFDLSYQVAADYDFIMKCYYQGYDFKNYNLDILCFTEPGFSQDHWLIATWENWQIATKHEGQFKVGIYYGFNLLFGLLVKLMKKILPKSLYQKIKNLWH